MSFSEDIKKPFNRRDVELKILEIESKYNYLINFANLVQNPVKCSIDSLNDSEEKSHRTEQREAICFCDFCLTDGI